MESSRLDKINQLKIELCQTIELNHFSAENRIRNKRFDEIKAKNMPIYSLISNRPLNLITIYLDYYGRDIICVLMMRFGTDKKISFIKYLSLNVSTNFSITGT